MVRAEPLENSRCRQKNLPGRPGVLLATMLCAPGTSAGPPLAERLRRSATKSRGSSPNDGLCGDVPTTARDMARLDQINKRNIGNLQLAWPRHRSSAIRRLRRSSMTASCICPVEQRRARRRQDRRFDLGMAPLPAAGAGTSSVSLFARNSIALYGDSGDRSTGDARLVALDACSGTVIWNVAVADYTVDPDRTAGPSMRWKVIAGILGRTTPDTGGGGWAHCARRQTGRELRRTYSIARSALGRCPALGVPLSNGSNTSTGSYDPEFNLAFSVRAASLIPPGSRQRDIPEQVQARIDASRLIRTAARSSGTFSICPETTGSGSRLRAGVGRRRERGELQACIADRGKTSIVWALDRKTGKIPVA